jgi:hypothetical protein
MERTPPIPAELWEQIPLHVQAVLWEVFDRYEARIAKLEAEVECRCFLCRTIR